MAAPAQAQISPGQLSQAHAELEANNQCLACHRQGQGVDAERCLSCHTLLEKRIDAGKGLHAQEDYQECRTCHIEHHGRDFDLVYWDGGPESLDHDLTGYVLEGKHATLGCRDCHQSQHVQPKRQLLKAGKDLDRTFLGLGTECLDCHDDTHRGQFEDVGCRSCHQLDAWIPAPLFDHQETSFPLTGQHRDVACAECHPSDPGSPDNDSSFVQYTGIAAETCMNCHNDPHEARFGTRCETCHATISWQASIDRSSFDHDQTRYPLQGLHRDVTCEDCHTSGKLTEPITGFDRCESCHEDEHDGQFSDREGGDSCDSCHNPEGFRPSLYTLEDHQRSSFPLEESHLAVPCFSCHSDALIESFTLQIFTLDSAACTACHDDAHAGELDDYLEPDERDTTGCVSCHTITIWRAASFDHDRSVYPLEGRHVDVACESCHPRQDLASGLQHGLMQLSGVPTACAKCHDDPHAGQFERDGRVISCESCHTVFDWHPDLFDHNRDAAYVLEGAHLDVPCEECHPTVINGENTHVLYRPRPTQCADCHRRDLQ